MMWILKFLKLQSGGGQLAEQLSGHTSILVLKSFKALMRFCLRMNDDKPSSERISLVLMRRFSSHPFLFSLSSHFFTASLAVCEVWGGGANEAAHRAQQTARHESQTAISDHWAMPSHEMTHCNNNGLSNSKSLQTPRTPDSFAYPLKSETKGLSS